MSNLLRSIVQFLLRGSIQSWTFHNLIIHPVMEVMHNLGLELLSEQLHSYCTPGGMLRRFPGKENFWGDAALTLTAFGMWVYMMAPFLGVVGSLIVIAGVFHVLSVIVRGLTQRC